MSNVIQLKKRHTIALSEHVLTIQTTVNGLVEANLCGYPELESIQSYLFTMLDIYVRRIKSPDEVSFYVNTAMNAFMAIDDPEFDFHGILNEALTSDTNGAA